MIKKSFNGIFKEKKVLITGHTGFKGSWLSIWLNELGADVIGFSLAPDTDPNNYDISGLEKRITSIIGDLRNAHEIKDAIDTYKPEIIFHLAAQTIVRSSYKDPKLTYDTNISGLINLFEAIRATDHVKVILNVTSDKCYENKETMRPYNELDQIGGIDPYSASKACSEIISSSYRRAFFKDNDILLATARAGNVIGGGDWAVDRIIPDCVKAISAEKDIIIRSPKANRPWQHVLEPLSGYIWLVALMFEKKNGYADCWNFGPKSSVQLTVEEMVNHIVKIWKGTYKVKETNDGYHEAGLLQLDCKKAWDKLNWRGILEIQEALNMTIEWYKHFYEGEINIYSMCQEQIDKYSELANNQNMPWATS